MNQLIKIGLYTLYHYTLIEDDLPGECFTFTQEQSDKTYKFLHPEGDFRYPVNWQVPYFHSLNEILAAFKKYVDTQESLATQEILYAFAAEWKEWD